MPRVPQTEAMRQYVEDELLRAPLLVDQAAEGAIDQLRKAMPTQSPAERSQSADLVRALMGQRSLLADPFVRSLREHAGRRQNPGPPPSERPMGLALVDEDVVALDVELSHMIEEIRSVAEHELRELGSFIAAIAGDMDVAENHNPFAPVAYARALWAAAQNLPVARAQQVVFLRHAATPLAILLRQSYAASCSRLESMGVEPAAYRTVLLSGGSRRRPGTDTTYSPDLHQIRQAMPGNVDAVSMRYDGQGDALPRLTERWHDVVRRSSATHVDRQAVELVSHLFEAMLADERVPADVGLLIARLHGPAMRLALTDAGLLDKRAHPLWRFIHLLAYEAEMAPDLADPERARLLRFGTQLIDALAASEVQRTLLYARALTRLAEFLRHRIERRCASAATQIGALEKLEDKLLGGQSEPTTVSGVFDLPVMDTVPAELMPGADEQTSQQADGEAWVDSLVAGTWVRMFLNLRWVQAQVLWPGERGELLLFGDGASDQTWAIRRGALVRMHAGALAKTLKMRSLVGSAAARVQEKMRAKAVPA